MLDFLSQEFDEARIHPGEFTISDAVARFSTAERVVSYSTAQRILRRMIEDGKVTRRRAQTAEGKQCWAYSEVKG